MPDRLLSKLPDEIVQDIFSTWLSVEGASTLFTAQPSISNMRSENKSLFFILMTTNILKSSGLLKKSIEDGKFKQACEPCDMPGKERLNALNLLSQGMINTEISEIPKADLESNLAKILLGKKWAAAKEDANTGIQTHNKHKDLLILIFNTASDTDYLPEEKLSKLSGLFSNLHNNIIKARSLGNPNPLNHYSLTEIKQLVTHLLDVFDKQISDDTRQEVQRIINDVIPFMSPNDVEPFTQRLQEMLQDKDKLVRYQAVYSLYELIVVYKKTGDVKRAQALMDHLHLLYDNDPDTQLAVLDIVVQLISIFQSTDIERWLKDLFIFTKPFSTTHTAYVIAKLIAASPVTKIQTRMTLLSDIVKNGCCSPLERRNALHIIHHLVSMLKPDATQQLELLKLFLSVAQDSVIATELLQEETQFYHTISDSLGALLSVLEAKTWKQVKIEPILDLCENMRNKVAGSDCALLIITSCMHMPIDDSTTQTIQSLIDIGFSLIKSCLYASKPPFIAAFLHAYYISNGICAPDNTAQYVGNVDNATEAKELAKFITDLALDKAKTVISAIIDHSNREENRGKGPLKSFLQTLVLLFASSPEKACELFKPQILMLRTSDAEAIIYNFYLWTGDMFSRTYKAILFMLTKHMPQCHLEAFIVKMMPNLNNRDSKIRTHVFDVLCAFILQHPEQRHHLDTLKNTHVEAVALKKLGEMHECYLSLKKNNDTTKHAGKSNDNVAKQTAENDEYETGSALSPKR